MATFAVNVLPIRDIEPIKGADFIVLAVVGDYRSVVKKGDFKPGDLVAYIPEASLVPRSLLAEMGLEGKLAGSGRNRVKAVKFRKCLSQGLCYPAREGWVEGQDVTEELGITKWAPPIPTSMSGQVYSHPGWTLNFDIENVKRYPDVLLPGEEVVFTEKLHGTWTCIGVLPPGYGHPEQGDVVISSKGLSAKGLAIKPNVEANEKNLYVRVAKAFDIPAKIRAHFGTEGVAVYVLGETFGKGVQDLTYGADSHHDDALGFRVFDIYMGRPEEGGYLGYDDMVRAVTDMGLESVPLLYKGPFSKDVMLEYTDGRETLTGKGVHLREGLVVKPTHERRDNEIGRVILKSVSDKYLTRKDGTEFE